MGEVLKFAPLPLTFRLPARGGGQVLRPCHKYACSKAAPDLLPYAESLYQNRDDAGCRADLILHAEKLLRAQTELLTRGEEEHVRSVVERACALVTYYLWIGTQRDLLGKSFVDVYTLKLLHEQAHQICTKMLAAAYECSSADDEHLFFILQLARAELVLGTTESQALLNEIARHVPTAVSDPNQRALLYMRLGGLLRDTPRSFIPFNWMRGMYWGIRSCHVFGCSEDVIDEAMRTLFWG